MARYIDAEKIDFRIPYYPDEEGGDALVSIKTVKRCIDMTPTEDVVPKSEVEDLSGKYENLELKYADLQKDHDELIAWGGHIKSTDRAEIGKAVAREIFEEIEKKVKASLTIHLEEINKEHIKDTPLYDRHSGIIFAFRAMDDFIAELKKKYTENLK